MGCSSMGCLKTSCLGTCVSVFMYPLQVLGILVHASQLLLLQYTPTLTHRYQGNTVGTHDSNGHIITTSMYHFPSTQHLHDITHSYHQPLILFHKYLPASSSCFPLTPPWSPANPGYFPTTLPTAPAPIPSILSSSMYYSDLEHIACLLYQHNLSCAERMACTF